MILCLNEIKIDQEQLDSTKIHADIPSHYAQYWNCCKSRKGYSGTAVFTKVKPNSVVYDFKGHDQEGRSITLEFAEFFIVCAYVPNSGDELKRADYRIQSWDKDFFNYLLSLPKPVILTGDLNVILSDLDMYEPMKQHKPPNYKKPEERVSFLKFMDKSKWTDTFRHFYPLKRQYTYWTTKYNHRPINYGWRSDFFIVSP